MTHINKKKDEKEINENRPDRGQNYKFTYYNNQYYHGVGNKKNSSQIQHNLKLYYQIFLNIFK